MIEGYRLYLEEMILKRMDKEIKEKEEKKYSKDIEIHFFKAI